MVRYAKLPIFYISWFHTKCGRWCYCETTGMSLTIAYYKCNELRCYDGSIPQNAFNFVSKSIVVSRARPNDTAGP